MKRISTWTTAFASIQWLFFIFANTIVVPISVGTAFELPPQEIAGIVRSSLIVTGIACVLQGWIGHRFPLMEGHSGIMWGLVLSLALSASSMGESLTSVGGGIATGMLLAGGVTVVLGAFRLLSFLNNIFTPMVMSVYLFLLTFQLILIFFNGMLKVTDDGALDLSVSLFSIAIVAFVGLLKIKGGRTIGNFSILIGMVAGWILYVLLFPAESSQTGNMSPAGVPIFPFGAPNWNVSMIVVSFLASLINLSNTIAAVRSASALFGEKEDGRRTDRSYLLTGFYSIVAAVFGLVSYAPFASSIGFLETTRIFDRKPFLIGGGLMAVLGIFPMLSGFLAMMPVTVGNAVLFAAYMQLFGTSLKSLEGYRFNSITIHRLAVPVLAGFCIMNADPSLFGAVPDLLRPLVSNGFIVGVILSILLEKLVRWPDAPEADHDSAAET